jgi:hypothetical protein
VQTVDKSISILKIYWNTFSQQFLFDSVLSAKHELAEILGVTHGHAMGRNLCIGYPTTHQGLNIP